MTGGIEYTVQAHATHVELTCVGTYTDDAARVVFTQAFEIAAQAERRAILVDGRLVAGRPPTLTQRYSMAIHVTALQRKRLPLIALAILGHEPMVDAQRFGETVARNRGAVARVFTNEERAREWLLSQT
jgi:hypothetical protein